MNIAHFTVSRPIFTVMATLIAVIIGGIALSRLPIDLMPDVNYPTLTVSTSYENASPEEMEELITRPMEGTVAAVPGVEEITSISGEGISNVRVQFAWGTDLDVAANDLRDRIDRITNTLPEDAERPQLRKFDVASFPILILGISSPLDPIELRQIIDEQIAYRIERMPGVAALDVWGGLEREVQVQLDADRVKALGLPLDRILQAIREANLTVPAGEVTRGNFEVTLRTPGRFNSLNELRNSVVAVREGAPIYLYQIATVEDTHRKITRIIRIDGEPGVRLAVRKQSGANTVEVARQVLREVERLNADFPQIRLVPVIDTSEYIQRSIDNVSRSILYGGALAVLVLLFFLRSLKSTLVVATAIPISIITTFALIYFGGFTLNLMTLGGLALGVGMMVDNAIVVLENITRLREEEQLDQSRAAIDGTQQVAAAIIASTLTTLVIFLPVIFAQGLAGALFQQLAYVVGFSLICSLLVALTLVPMLASRLLGSANRPVRMVASKRLRDWSARLFGHLEERYHQLLQGALRRRGWLLIMVTALFLGCLALTSWIGGEFMPATDEGEVRVNAEMEPGTRLEMVDRQLRKIESIVAAEVPEARASVVSIGASSYRPSAAATGEIRLSLVPAVERNRSSEQIATELRDKLVDIPGVVIRTRAGQGLFLLRRLGAGDQESLQVEIRGFALQTLDSLGAAVRDALSELPGITDVRLSREAGVPQELLRIDRERAADLGVSVAQVARALQTAIAGSSAGEYREGGDEIRILVKLQDAEQMNLEDILDLTIVNEDGEQVVLRNLVEPQSQRGPIQIERKDQQRIAMVLANISGRDLASVAEDVQERLRTIPLPRTYDITLAGDYEEQRRAFRELLITFVLAIVLVYMVMACLYESLRDPLIVMFSVPLAAIGVILILLLTGTTFNVQSFIGCIMLAGIVVNNAILIVDQASRLRRDEGRATRDAVIEAGRRRLRPILMTSVTTLLALLPLALGIGEGAEAQAPLARAVIGGLLTATFITLVFIPVVYTLFYRDKCHFPKTTSVIFTRRLH